MARPWLDLAGRDEEVADLEVARVMGGERRPPRRIVGQKRLGVTANDADDDFGDDPSADIAQAVATAANRSFAEDVQPQRCLILPVTEGEFLRRQRLCADGACDRLAGWQRGAHSALEISRGK